MKYEIFYDVFMFLFGLMVSGYMIYIGIRQLKRVPFIIRRFSNRAGIVLSGVLIFSFDAIKFEFHIVFSLIALCLIILFITFLYIDYKKYYLLNIYNIDQETLAGLLERFSEDKDFKFEIIDDTGAIDSLYNEVRIYKSKSIKNIRILKRDLESYLSNMPCKKFRVKGLFYVLLGIGFIYLYMKLILW